MISSHSSASTGTRRRASSSSATMPKTGCLAEYGDLGLPPAELRAPHRLRSGRGRGHARLATRLGAPAVLSTFSRLLIDPNRGEDDPTLIMRLSDGAVVPGNAAVDEGERARRIARYPCALSRRHRRGDRRRARRPAARRSSSRSTASRRSGAAAPRPWQAGVLWDSDPRLALPLIAALRAEGDLVVGDNEPYSGALADDCLYRHALAARPRPCAGRDPPGPDRRRGRSG